MISLRDKHEHAIRRRPWTKAFSTAALKGYEDLITNRCVQLVDVLAHQVGVVDLSKWLSFFTYVPLICQDRRLSWSSYDFMNDIAYVYTSVGWPYRKI
jgi:cytochrome P450